MSGKETVSINNYEVQIDELLDGIEPNHTVTGTKNTFLRIAARAYPGPKPPSYVHHAGQMSVLVGELLIHQEPEVQEDGQIFVFGHDMGRAVDMGRLHTLAGARILRKLGYEERFVIFALSHHRWGLGERALSHGGFITLVQDAMENGNFPKAASEIINTHGVAALSTLLADNSKKPIFPGSFDTHIVPYDLGLATSLINAQIERGRYTRESEQHHIDEFGSQFLFALIPHIEEQLGVRYAPDGTGNDAISRSLVRWPEERAVIDRLWTDISSSHP